MVKMPYSIADKLKKQFNTTDFDSKISFEEFLQLLQRESFFRDALIDA